MVLFLPNRRVAAAAAIAEVAWLAVVVLDAMTSQTWRLPVLAHGERRVVARQCLLAVVRWQIC